MSMPALTINLLTKRRERYRQQQNVNTKIKLVSGVILSIYIVVLAAIFMVNLYFAREAANLEDAVKEAKLAVSIRIKDQVELATVSVKSKAIGDIIDKRATISALWKAIQGILPTGAQLQSFGYEGSKLTVGIDANHFVSANKIIDTVEQSNLGFEVKKSILGISRSEEASYRLSLDLSLPPASKGGK